VTFVDDSVVDALTSLPLLQLLLLDDEDEHTGDCTAKERSPPFRDFRLADFFFRSAPFIAAVRASSASTNTAGGCRLATVSATVQHSADSANGCHIAVTWFAAPTCAGSRLCFRSAGGRRQSPKSGRRISSMRKLCRCRRGADADDGHKAANSGDSRWWMTRRSPCCR